MPHCVRENTVQIDCAFREPFSMCCMPFLHEHHAIFSSPTFNRYRYKPRSGAAFNMMNVLLQVYGPSVSEQPSESTGTALFTRYLSCRFHGNPTHIACPCMSFTMVPFLPYADSYPVQIPTLCRFPCSCMILTWLPLPSIPGPAFSTPS